MAPISIASAASAMSSVTSGPIMCTPRTLSVLASAMTLHQPSVSLSDIARPDAANGNLPSTGSKPAFLASSIDRPTDAISGSVKITAGMQAGS